MRCAPVESTRTCLIQVNTIAECRGGRRAGETGNAGRRAQVVQHSSARQRRRNCSSRQCAVVQRVRPARLPPDQGRSGRLRVHRHRLGPTGDRR